MDPSNRTVSPFIMPFSSIEVTIMAYSSGLPRRLGKGTVPDAWERARSVREQFEPFQVIP